VAGKLNIVILAKVVRGVGGFDFIKEERFAKYSRVITVNGELDDCKLFNRNTYKR